MVLSQNFIDTKWETEVLLELDTIAVIPARSGSKGLPDKNISKVSGVSLLALSVRFARALPRIKNVFVSTDSQKYREEAMGAGADACALRPSALAQDNSKTVDVLLALLDEFEVQPKYLLLLQTTAPVRTVKQVEEAFRLISEPDTDAVVALTKLEEPHPYKLQKIGADGFIEPFLEKGSERPRQELPYLLKPAGSIYLIKTQALRRFNSLLPPKTIPLIVPDAPNIDTLGDLILLRALYEQGLIEIFSLPPFQSS